MKLKRILSICFAFLLMVCVLDVYAESVKELHPKVYIEGMDTNAYDIRKTIDEEHVIVTIKEKGTKVYYSWTFDRNKVPDTIYLNFELKFDSPNADVIDAMSKDNKDKLYLSFSHHGQLPSSAQIKIYVGDKYSNGEKLYLYYYNEEKNVIEYKDRNLEVKHGYVTIDIDHCSDYFLTGTIVNDAVDNPKTMNYIIAVMVVIILILVGATIFSTKR